MHPSTTKSAAHNDPEAIHTLGNDTCTMQAGPQFTRLPTESSRHERALKSFTASCNGFQVHANCTHRRWGARGASTSKSTLTHAPMFLSRQRLTTSCPALASGSKDQTVRVWGVASGQCIHQLQAKAIVVRVAGSRPHAWDTPVGFSVNKIYP